MIWRKLLDAVFEYANHCESGDQTRPLLPRSRLFPPTSSVVIFSEVKSSKRIRTSSSTKAMNLPSGDQVGSQAIFDSPIEMALVALKPS